MVSIFYRSVSKGRRLTNSTNGRKGSTRRGDMEGVIGVEAGSRGITIRGGGRESLVNTFMAALSRRPTRKRPVPTCLSEPIPLRVFVPGRILQERGPRTPRLH